MIILVLAQDGQIATVWSCCLVACVREEVKKECTNNNKLKLIKL